MIFFTILDLKSLINLFLLFSYLIKWFFNEDLDSILFYFVVIVLSTRCYSLFDYGVFSV